MRQFNNSGKNAFDDKTNREFEKKKKRKICRFCEKKMEVDYKDLNTLSHLITPRGKIIPKRITGTCSKHQKLVSKGIKKNRNLALMPYSAEFEL